MSGPAQTMTALESRYAQGSLFPFAPTATIEIDAPAAVVWEVLSDFRRYGDWNRFTPSVVCSGELGSTVEMQVCFPGKKPMRQVEVLNVLEPPRRIAWGMHMGTAAVLVANRYQTLEPVGQDRTRYTTIDYLSGLLAPVVRLLYAQHMRAGFELAARCLKAQAEARHRS